MYTATIKTPSGLIQIEATDFESFKEAVASAHEPYVNGPDSIVRVLGDNEMVGTPGGWYGRKTKPKT